ncbi:hypothetical protein JW998_13210 [candidate division KSB1 bacterium]|nr:hypothetical protein [candidate division KSB1 bacterium]
MKKQMFLLCFFLLLCACAENEKGHGAMFKDDVAFLRKYTDVLVLTENARAQIAVVPGLQGRVMTSTADGADGLSFGWINRELIASGDNNRHMNAFGGEDRFWLGPEGGQFSIFFKKGDPFDLEHWWTPPPINEGGYDIAEQANHEVRFRKTMQLENYSGKKFDLDLNRIVRLLSQEKACAIFGRDLRDVRLVAFQSENTITNIGATPWEKATGLLSIWILGMYNPSPATTIVIPFMVGAEDDLGPIVNDAYFGTVPPDRLVVRDDVIFFRGDGACRSKIGLSPQRATSVLGSYDAANGVLTLVHYNKPDDAVDYVNSMWEIQEAPFAGDVVNSYNDGPATGAAPMGPFYELETSSPAAALAPGESLTHLHTTLHVQGDAEALDGIARAVLGVGVKEIAQVF